MQELRSKLLELGLKKNEAEIYLALFKYGELTSYDLANKTSLIRTNIYDILKKLRVLGLISEKTDGRKKYHYANNPSAILALVESKNIIAKTLVSQLIKIKPEEKEISFEFYEGSSALISLLTEAMSQKEDFKVLGATDYQRLLTNLPDFLIEKLLGLKQKNQIKTRMIVTSNVTPINSKEYEYKFLDLEIPMSILIYADIVLLGDFGSENPSIVKIKSKKYLRFFDNLFEFLWELN